MQTDGGEKTAEHPYHYAEIAEVQATGRTKKLQLLAYTTKPIQQVCWVGLVFKYFYFYSQSVINFDFFAFAPKTPPDASYTCRSLLAIPRAFLQV